MRSSRGGAETGTDGSLQPHMTALKQVELLAPLGAWEWDPATGRCFWSDGLFQIFGHEPQAFEPTYDDFLAAVHPDDRQRWSAADQQGVQTGEAFKSEFRIVRPSGEIRIVLCNTHFESAGEGQSMRAFGICYDVTEWRAAQDALRRNGERLRAALDAAQVGTWSVDLRTNLDTRDDRVNRILGLPATPTTTPLDDFMDRVHPDDRAGVLESLDQALETGRYRRELRVVRPDGEVRWILEQGHVTRDEAGMPLVLTGASVDITELRAMEEAACASAQRLKEVLESTSDCVLFIDENWRIQFLNERAVEEIGGGRDLVGFDIWEEFPEAIGSVLWDNYHATMKDRIPRDFEALLQPADAWYEVRVRPSGRGISVFLRNITDRRKAEQRIRLQATLLDAVEQAVIATDLKGKIIHWNRFAETLFGWRAAEVLGRPVNEVTPAPQSIADADAIMARLTAGESWSGEFLLRKRDGSVFPAQVTDSPVHDEQGQLVGVVGIAVDISGRKAAEAALRQSEERLQFALEAGCMFAFERDLESASTVRSAGALAILGEQDIPLEESSRRIHVDDRDHVIATIEASAAAGSRYSIEYRYHRPDGRTIWLCEKGRVVEEAESGRKRLFGIVYDITVRKEQEERLAARERYYRDLLEALPVAVYTTDPEGSLTFFNEAAVKFGGFRPELGSAQWYRAFQLFWPDGSPVPDAQRPVVRVLRDGQPAGGIEAVVQRPDGSRVPFVAYPTPLRDASGNMTGIVGTLVDITEQKNTEQQLRRAQKMEAIGQLTGGVAHDFNNLLMVIFGNAEILLGALDGQPLRAVAEAIMEAAERGADLTQRMLAFGRRQTLRPETVCANQVIRDICRMLQRTIGAQISLNTRLASDLPAASVDRSLFETAILNLLVNARDAMPQGGRLLVETAAVDVPDGGRGRGYELRPGRYVKLTISDDGVGMAPESVERAFEPFFTTKEVGKGSGLGLAMVYGFAKQSGGHVSLRSELQVGTTVELLLPAAEMAEAGVRGGQKQEPEAETRREKILVVEDEPDVRRFVACQLLSLGYDVVQASAGPAALTMLERDGSIELLFTDIVLPEGISGLELARRARAIRPGLRVLFTSGYPDDAIDRHGAGGRDFLLLRKPYHRHQLASALQEALTGRVSEGSAWSRRTRR